MLPRSVYLVRYRFKKNKGKYGYFVSASRTKVMKKFREFSSICGEGLKPKSKVEKYYTETGDFIYSGKDLYFEITVATYI